MNHLRPRAALALLVLLMTNGGCSLGYYLHSASGQAALLSKRVPIAEVLADPATPESLRERLRRVQQAREFASSELGLPARKGYRSYANLERDYAVWSVTATPEFSLTPKQWCFPVAGCVSYRGYFSKDKAEAFAARLARQGFDVAVRGAAAYSTLGYFDDPVLSSMMRWDDTQLVAIIFHELAHQLLYVKNDTPFNESFASVVEFEGMARWTKSHGELEEFDRYLQRRASAAVFAQLVGDARDELQQLYLQALPDQERRSAKRAVLLALRQRYEALRDSGEVSAGYDNWFAQDLNNAHLAAVGVYQQWVPALSGLLEQKDRDLGRFYAAARSLAEQDPDARRAALERLSP